MVRSSILFLLVALVASCSAEGSVRAATTIDNSSTQQRRELFSWLSILFLIGPKPDCNKPKPHGPLGHAWDHHCSGGSSSSSGGSSSSSSSSSSSASSGESQYYNVEDSSGGTSSSGAQGASSNQKLLWPLLVAAVAATTAMAAVIVGQRRDPEDRHQLQGSVARRMDLFSNFADRALCNNESRPGRVVEMTKSTDDYAMA